MVEPVRRSALEDHWQVGDVVAPGQSARVEFSRPAYATLFELNGAPDPSGLAKALSAPSLTEQMLNDVQGLSLIWTGPGRWLIVSKQNPATVRAQVEAALSSRDATLVDLSHARTIFALDGPAAVEVLCKGCPAEVETLPLNGALSTVLGHFSVVITRIGEMRYEVQVFRSFGLDLWEWFQGAAREYGYRVN